MLYSLALKAARRFPSWSRLLFGTDAAMPGVIKGFVALRNHRRIAPVPIARRFVAIVEDMDRVGYAPLGQPYDSERLARIAGRFEALTKRDNVWKYRFESSGDVHKEAVTPASERGPRSPDDRMVQRDLLEPAHHIPEAVELLDPPTVEMLESCYRTHFRLVRIAYWRNYHVPPAISEREEVGYSHYRHHDGHAIDTLKLFVVMSDVSPEDGPFHVVAKAESRRIVRRAFDRGRAKHSEELASVRPFTLTGPLGTAALCNTTLCLHRAGIPSPGRQRDLLQFQFVSSATPFTPDAWRRCSD